MKFIGFLDRLITIDNSFFYLEIPTFVCNDQNYGHIMIPLDENENLLDDYQQLIDLKMAISGKNPSLVQIHSIFQ